MESTRKKLCVFIIAYCALIITLIYLLNGEQTNQNTIFNSVLNKTQYLNYTKSNLQRKQRLPQAIIIGSPKCGNAYS